jgi:hypothetical protein
MSDHYTESTEKPCLVAAYLSGAHYPSLPWWGYLGIGIFIAAVYLVMR